MIVDDNEIPLDRDIPAMEGTEILVREEDFVAIEDDLDVFGDAIDPAFDDTEDLDDDLDPDAEDDAAEMALLQELGIDLDSSDETGVRRDLIAPLGEDDPYDDEMAA